MFNVNKNTKISILGTSTFKQGFKYFQTQLELYYLQ